MEKSWESFKRMIYVNAPIDSVYDCFAIPSKIETWFLKSASYKDQEGLLRMKDESTQKGDSYIWTWYIYTGTEEGEILEANGHDHYAFSFANSVVDVRLEKAMDMTLISLEQKEIDQDEETKMNIYNGCSNGWTFWLTNLKAWLEHGVLLHQKEAKLLQVGNNHDFING